VQSGATNRRHAHVIDPAAPVAQWFVTSLNCLDMWGYQHPRAQLAVVFQFGQLPIDDDWQRVRQIERRQRAVSRGDKALSECEPQSCKYDKKQDEAS